jgi:hypothetical protein
MTTTVSRVDVLLDVDGRGVPRKVKAISRRVGEIAGQEMGERFNKSLEEQLSGWGNKRLDIMRERFKREGRASGRLFGLNLRQASDKLIEGWADDIVQDMAKVFTFADSDGWDRWVKNVGSVSEAYAKMSRNIDIAENEGRVQAETADHLRGVLLKYAAASREAEYQQEVLARKTATLNVHMQKLDDLLSASAFRRHTQEVGDLGTAYQRTLDRINAVEKAGGDQRWADRARLKLMDLADAAHKAADGADNTNRSYRSLPHGLRQAIFWVTLVVAAFENLAVLGSAAGGGIMVFFNTLFAGGVGLGVAIAAFADLNKELKDLPESSHAAVKAFDLVQEAFGDLQDRISERVLAGVAPAFERLAGLVERLGPSFDVVSDAVVVATDNLSKLFASDKGFSAFDKAIRNAAPIFERLADASGDFVIAMLDFFGNKEVQRSTLEFIEYVDDLIAKFDDFTQNGGLDEWMRNTREVFGALEPLLDRVGTLFNELVTPETVDRTVNFLGSLTEAMGFVQDILEVIGELDVFGILGQVLENLGAMLGPVLDGLKPVADIIGTVITFFGELGEVWWNIVSPIFLPMQLAWETVNLALERFVEWAQPVLDALSELGEEVALLGEDIWVDLEPALSDLFDAFLDLLPEPEELARIIREDVIPQIRNFANWITKTLVPALEGVIGWLEDVIESLGGWDGISAKLGVIGRAFQIFTLVVQFALSPIIWLIERITDGINWILSNLPKAVGNGTTGGGLKVPQMASGGISNGPEIIQWGEAGKEMIIPLEQPLARIDPSVRDVAAYAQGKGGSGRGDVDIDIVVQGSDDPRRTALEVADAVAEVINS